jgi:hypothetical protein
VDGDSDEHIEFIQIKKRLEWSLLKRAPHEVSIFEDLSGEPPTYMQRRNSEQFPDFNGWYSGRKLQQALQAAIGMSEREGGTGSCRAEPPPSLTE